ncbi:transglutaminase-like cysteine peptidase [Mesorhizobium sp. KR2-14]|uniref:transglutaminase-like cysteine peptidase n=1 Tax=Mesorhizobium sp. KR2-14 TaxID=3156610 RepID=UPI0032B332DF
MNSSNNNAARSKQNGRIISALLICAGQGIAAQAVADPLIEPAAPKSIAASAFLGGVALQTAPAEQRVPAYDFAAGSKIYAPAPSKARVVASAAGVDTMKTASIAPGVFGSVALPMRNFPVSARWSLVNQAINSCATDAGCSDDPQLRELLDGVRGKSFREKLAVINGGINRMITYKPDSEVYGQLDYWAKPSEILGKRAGDCEDFAILKMAALLEVGIPAQSMSVVVLQDRRLRVFHAVLSVSTASGNFILDNVRNTVLVDSQLPDYQPLYSFSQERAWIHGAKPGAMQLADVAGGFGKIAPGEGPLPAGQGTLAIR